MRADCSQGSNVCSRFSRARTKSCEPIADAGRHCIDSVPPWSEPRTIAPVAKPKAVLFDLDGVLIESENAWLELTRAAMQSPPRQSCPHFPQLVLVVARSVSQ